MIRVAAVGDIHLGADSGGSFRHHLARLDEQADALLHAGDLTKRGTGEEARAVGTELADLPVPTVAVPGNHDYESDQPDALSGALRAGGASVLEGDSVTCTIRDCTVGIAGVKGFGGGFAGRCGSEFGEPEMKAFIRHGEATATELDRALRTVSGADLRIALTHYPQSRTHSGARTARSIHFLVRTSWPRPSTAPRSRWRCTVMRTAVRRLAERRGALPFETSPFRSLSGPTGSSASAPTIWKTSDNRSGCAARRPACPQVNPWWRLGTGLPGGECYDATATTVRDRR